MTDMDRITEDIQNYDEFIPTFYKWKTPDEQRKIVNRLENATKNKSVKINKFD